MPLEIRDDFDLEKIAQSGQCFRVRKFGDGGYRFLTGEHAVYIRETKESEYAVSCGEDEWRSVWVPYFDLTRDYRKLRRQEHGKNAFADKAMACGKGLRVLRQEPWETLVTFILSQRKSIPAIAKSVEGLSAAYGHTVTTEYETIFAFPSPEEMACATEEELRNCGLGYRAPYVLDAVSKVLQGGLDLTRISDCGDEELLSELKKVRGVGKKVAGCVALFAYGRTACVPVDVWIGRAIEEDCHGQSPFPVFSENAGIIQQYVFYYERSRH